MRNTEASYVMVSAGEHDGKALPVHFLTTPSARTEPHVVALYEGTCTEGTLVATQTVPDEGNTLSLPCDLIGGRRYVLVYRLGPDQRAPIAAQFLFTPAP